MAKKLIGVLDPDDNPRKKGLTDEDIEGLRSDGVLTESQVAARAEKVAAELVRKVYHDLGKNTEMAELFLNLFNACIQKEIKKRPKKK